MALKVKITTTQDIREGNDVDTNVVSTSQTFENEGDAVAYVIQKLNEAQGTLQPENATYANFTISINKRAQQPRWGNGPGVAAEDDWR